MAQRVSAYQAGSYQPGLMNVRDLAPPGAGIVFLDYNYWNNSNSYVDQFGKKISSLEIDLAPIDPSFGKVTLDLEQQVSGYANVPVLFYSSRFKILNARYMASINPVYLSSNYRMNVHASDTSVFSSGNASGFGDLSFIPLGLGWSIKDKIDVSFFYMVYAPTGKYETGARAALPIWIDYMQYFLSNQSFQYFDIPDGTKMVYMNPDTGQISKIKTSHFVKALIKIKDQK